jgi:hypothetical protein
MYTVFSIQYSVAVAGENFLPGEDCSWMVMKCGSIINGEE